ncbi:MAG: Cob(I)yrinic acid a,c-diamide adenosyltransferase [Phycisphaerae bacterium]|nr:Cob(I)yrinic acid a,c-diamide adenosyltransferase [Phycisphaerae bacterium]
MKLYTRTGDDGTTGLFGGQRVAKNAPRIEAYGTVDELNSVVGLARSACGDARMGEMLTAIQNELFVVGGDLATPGDTEARGQIVPILTAESTARLEGWIDELCEPLPPMKHFILPGGCELASRLHVARTLCRRAERVILTLGMCEPINENIIPWVNRLGDLLFAAARRANQLAGVEDVPWQPRKK